MDIFFFLGIAQNPTDDMTKVSEVSDGFPEPEQCASVAGCIIELHNLRREVLLILDNSSLIALNICLYFPKELHQLSKKSKGLILTKTYNGNHLNLGKLPLITQFY